MTDFKNLLANNEARDLGKLMLLRGTEARLSVLQLIDDPLISTAVMVADCMNVAETTGAMLHALNAKTKPDPDLNPLVWLMEIKALVEVALVERLRMEVMAGRDPFRDFIIKPGLEADAKAGAEELMKTLKNKYAR